MWFQGKDALMRRSAWTLAVAVVAALSLGVAACGGGSSNNNKKAGNTNATTPPKSAKQGGVLTVLWGGDVDHIDCGQAYYQMSYFICYSTQRPLYSYKPDDGATIVPDLAQSAPEVSPDDSTGKAVGYKSGTSIHLVRNPNWDKSTDFKPAYLDEINNLEGNDDPQVASRRILTGKSMLNGDWSPPPAIVKQAVSQYKSQITFVGGAGNRYVSMNTTVKPFDNINVRKAVSAAFDRNAMRLTRGGPLIGDIATHFIMPGTPGFDEAGGMNGTGVDFLSKDGQPNMALAAEYMKKAGYASGKYTGTDPILMVGSNTGEASKAAEVTKQQFEKLGFKVTLRLVNTNTMYTRYCNSPAAKVAVCPNVGWIKDFADGQTVLDPTFNGKNILDQGNSNWPQLNDPTINSAMEKAEVAPADQRAAAWGNIDKMVTAQAVAVPWLWDKLALIESPNVNGVATQFNAQWDLNYTSLK